MSRPYLSRVVLVIGALLLSACQLDVAVTVDVEPDGTGMVTLVAVADAELVARVPDLADDLRLDDALANGWATSGPVRTEDGGLTIELTHEVRSADELANVLNSIGPPLQQMAAARTSDEEGLTTNAINGIMKLNGGFEAFADAELVQAVGGLPFADEFAAAGLTPAEAMSFTYRVGLPGELVRAEDGIEIADGIIEWQAPLDGSETSLYTETVQRPAGAGNSWAKPVSKIALIAFVVWVVLAAAFITFVAVARQRKQRRRMQALRRLERTQRIT